MSGAGLILLYLTLQLVMGIGLSPFPDEKYLTDMSDGVRVSSPQLTDPQHLSFFLKEPIRAKHALSC